MTMADQLVLCPNTRDASYCYSERTRTLCVRCTGTTGLIEKLSPPPPSSFKREKIKISFFYKKKIWKLSLFPIVFLLYPCQMSACCLFLKIFTFFLSIKHVFFILIYKLMYIYTVYKPEVDQVIYI